MRSDCTTCFDGGSDINLSSPAHLNKAKEWRSHCFRLVHYTAGSWASSENCVSAVVWRAGLQPAAETEMLSQSADIRHHLRILKEVIVADYKLDSEEEVKNSQMSAEIRSVTATDLCEKDRKRRCMCCLWNNIVKKQNKKQHTHNSVGISKDCLTVHTNSGNILSA